MKIASIRNRKAVLTAAEDNIMPPEKPEPKSKLLSIVLGKESPRRVHSDSKVKEGKRFGYIAVDNTRLTKYKEGRIAYPCTCDCGEKLFLTASELLKRSRMTCGCLGFYCNFSEPFHLVWHNPQYALAAQLSQALTLIPEEVSDNWGGTAYSTGIELEFDDALEVFLEDVWHMVDFKERSWWITRINPDLPFEPINIVMQPLPDKAIFKSAEYMVRHGNSILTVAQIAELMNVDVEVAHKLRAEHRSGDDFVNAIIEESLNEKQTNRSD